MKSVLAGISWDVCEPTHGSASQPSVSINIEAGRVSITAAAYDAAGRPEAFVSLYSPDHKSVGFRRADPRDALAVLVSNKGAAGHGGRQFAAATLTRKMRADGYSGSIYVPVQWHPDGLLWGDLTMATKRVRKAPMKRGAA